ncbi:hypothetical protein EV126DRAFT_429604 [Verticillium dahliae]|nr:hypothetical protein EV126DRAFT_429604 [Verticillium dahliae]
MAMNDSARLILILPLSNATRAVTVRQNRRTMPVWVARDMTSLLRFFRPPGILVSYFGTCAYVSHGKIFRPKARDLS